MQMTQKAWTKQCSIIIKMNQKGFLNLKKKWTLLFNEKEYSSESTKVLHTDHVIPYPGQTLDCIERDGWKIPLNMCKQSSVFSKQVAFQIVLCLYKLRKELVLELNSFRDQESL